MSISSKDSSDGTVTKLSASAQNQFKFLKKTKPVSAAANAIGGAPDAFLGDETPGPLSRNSRSSQPRRRNQHVWLLLSLALVVADIGAVVVAPLCVYWLRHGSSMPVGGEALSLDLSSLVALMSLNFCKAYDRSALRHPLRALQAVGLAWMWATTVVFLVGLYSHASSLGLTGAERQWLMSYWATSAGLVAFAHLCMTAIVAQLMTQGYLRERIVIVGADGNRSEKFIRQVIGSGSNEITILGLFDDRYGRTPDPAAPAPGQADKNPSAARIRNKWVDRVDGYPVLGNTDTLVTYVRRNSVDRVILLLPWSAEQRVTELITKLRQLPVRIDLLSHNLSWGFHTDVSQIAGIPVVTVANRRVDAQLGLLKRIEDIVLCSLLIVLLAPVLLLVAVMVKLSSPGPILFRQERYGFNNEVFKVYKFRSMYVHSDTPSVNQASKNDARVTPIGRFLRRSSLDELPQFFNVLGGTMSLVGPRPHAVPHNVKYARIIEGYYARHNVKPGITGWAQVNGHRGETDTTEKMRKRVEFDLYYIDHWSLYFDLKVIVLTACKIWFQKTAY